MEVNTLIVRSKKYRVEKPCYSKLYCCISNYVYEASSAVT